jgi:uncharacterized protein YggE
MRFVMKKLTVIALFAATAALPTPAFAQTQPVFAQSISGTRLDLSVTGEATRVPDVAIISAGVMTRAATARAAIQQNAARMDRVRAALKRAGIEDRDIQTSNISLNPDYRYVENKAPQLTGYNASNQVSVRFRDIARTGDILDALVAEGANQLNGPSLTIDKPEGALDEARTKALAMGRARADLYARSLNMQVARLISVSETGGGGGVPQPVVMYEMRAQNASTKIDPGEQKLSVTLQLTYELR